MKIFGFDLWPFVTKRTAAERVELARAESTRAGWDQGLWAYEAQHKADIVQTRRLLKDLIRYMPSSTPGANSNVVTLFFTDLLRHIKGDEAYARLVSEQAAIAIYQVVKDSRYRK